MYYFYLIIFFILINFFYVAAQNHTRNPYDCMDLSCFCSFIGGSIGPDKICILENGNHLTRAIRKEYRQLSDHERQRFHKVLQKLKKFGIFDGFNKQHKQAAAGSHLGPAFMPWHREFLKRFEIAIRMMDPGLAIPYWDSTMDIHLPEPKDSIIWSELFLGESDSDGIVINGPFVGWPTLEGRANIKRNLGKEGRPFNESDLDHVMEKTHIQDMLAYTALEQRQKCPIPLNYYALEFFHANIHFFVGGDMKPTETAGNDPTFYLLHSFVDYIWEMWRQKRQSRESRETEYTNSYVECGHPLHFWNETMHPFEILTNLDGLSNAYTDEMYEYSPRPNCSHENVDGCESQYLFCDTRFEKAKCVSKIKMNGNCTGFEEDFDACFNGECVDGICISIADLRRNETEVILMQEQNFTTILPVTENID